VEIGIIGVAIQSVILLGTFIAAIYKLIIAPTTEKMFFVMFMLFILYRSFGEVQVFFGFSDVSMLVYAICVYSLKKEESERRPSTRYVRKRLRPGPPSKPKSEPTEPAPVT
jgi:exopolysaccharide production protein ExoQ